MKKKGLFFVTTIREYKDEDAKHNLWDTRCIGYYTSLEKARFPVLNCDLCEAGWYQYVIIEEFSHGWYPDTISQEWYKFDKKGKAHKIQQPKKWKQTCNWGIG